MTAITPPSILSATFKDTPQDFIVTEQLDLDFDNQGEHLWLYVQKIGMNTAFVARLLADWAGISVRDVGYSGLKDRHAKTYQWYSLRLPSKTAPTLDFVDFAQEKLHDGESLAILRQHWHGRKLNRGTHKANHFTITLKNVAGDQHAIDAQLRHIAQHGTPNYFGEQRFGNDGNNLSNANQFFEKLISHTKPYKPHKKDLERHGILISTARSHLFNEILTQRVANGTWDTALAGDVFNLDGTGSIFTADIDDDIRQRLIDKDIHPTIALYGMGDNKATDQALALENAVFEHEKNTILVQGLQKVQAKMARRATRLLVRDLSWQWQDDVLTLDFTLPKGTFATVIIGALVANF